VRLRCDVLSAEETTLLSQLRQLDDQLTEHTRQRDTIESQQDTIQRQIDQLTHRFLYQASQIPGRGPPGIWLDLCNSCNSGTNTV